MTTPEGLKYTATHEWIRREEDGTVSIGITDFAQQALGDVVFVQLPAVGGDFKAGDAFAVVESVKAASDIYAPVSGSVVAVNETLSDKPEAINQEPYGAWLVRLAPADASQVDRLLDAAQYEATATERK
jgi:glycine cleavage system H protein